MSQPRSAFVEVYVFRRRGRRAEFLCLRRSRARRLPGVWQPVTGGRRRGETARAAARREVREETGLEPRRWWTLETPAIVFDARLDRTVVLPLFAAEVGPRDRVRLSPEHDAGAFLSARAAAGRYLWEAQRRALADVRRQVLRGGALADALELAGPGPALRTHAPDPRSGPTQGAGPGTARTRTRRRTRPA